MEEHWTRGPDESVSLFVYLCRYATEQEECKCDLPGDCVYMGIIYEGSSLSMLVFIHDVLQFQCYRGRR